MKNRTGTSTHDSLRLPGVSVHARTVHSTAEHARVLLSMLLPGQQQLPGGEHARTQHASLPQLRQAGEVVLEYLQQEELTGGEADLRVAAQK